HGLLEKNNLYESVYRIPLIISFPGKIGAGSVINTYVSIVDFQPTLLNLLDLPLSAQEQGRDVSCLFEHDSADWEEAVFIHPNDVPRAGILTREYELAYVGSGWQNQKEFKDHILFDRKNDIDQMHNLFYNKAYQPVIEKLTVKMAEHFKKLHFDKNKLPPPLSALL
ncbi:MAG: sulfatase/phosphatase domain-containing protein, partial [Treponema lecithinolyticum]